MSIQETATSVRTGSVDTEGDTIVFDVRGQGAPLALLSGTPGDASAFALVVDDLAADHTVVTYDPRGFGRSSGNEPRRYEIGQLARDVVAVLQAAGTPVRSCSAAAPGPRSGSNSRRTIPRSSRGSSRTSRPSSGCCPTPTRYRPRSPRSTARRGPRAARRPSSTSCCSRSCPSTRASRSRPRRSRRSAPAPTRCPGSTSSSST
ncbi:alpha/beta fold hydrolase [Agromyces protaetiae]|uniref:Alpha/beta fold hydrolase n=1 Tax=Agromyces protaetiae TaxID=2509455 RepID=A0A4P6FGM4_9MICO|nr:alpha/beta fold hydrolase [Agromyces protaetiae]